MGLSQREDHFKDTYGSSPDVITAMWNAHRTTTNEDAHIAPGEMTIKQYLIAHNLIAKYGTLKERARLFRLSKPTITKWGNVGIKKIAAFEAQKCSWPEDWVAPELDLDDDVSSESDSDSDYEDEDEDEDDDDDDYYDSDDEVPVYVLLDEEADKLEVDETDEDSAPPLSSRKRRSSRKQKRPADGRVFRISIDGTQFWIEEPIDPDFRKNTKFFSFKFKHAGVNVEIALDLFQDRAVWINGPFVGSMHDITIFRKGGLREKLKACKTIKAIADKGYRGEKKYVSTHNSLDTPEVQEFKKRALARHESYNKRLKNFGCLSQRFRHKFENFRMFLLAVAVTVQFQIENGSPLFDVVV